jgi:hypothetical protein
MDTTEKDEEREYEVMVSRRRVVSITDTARVYAYESSPEDARASVLGLAILGDIEWTEGSPNESVDNPQVEHVKLVLTEQEAAAREAQEERPAADALKIIPDALLGATKGNQSCAMITVEGAPCDKNDGRLYMLQLFEGHSPGKVAMAVVTFSDDEASFALHPLLVPGRTASDEELMDAVEKWIDLAGTDDLTMQ